MHACVFCDKATQSAFDPGYVGMQVFIIVAI